MLARLRTFFRSSGFVLNFRRVWLLILLWAILASLALQTQRDLFFRLSYLILLVVLVSFVWAVYSIQSFRLERRLVTPRTQVGKLAEERFVAVSTGRLPKLFIELDDFSDLPGHRVSRVLNALAPRVRYSWNVRTLCRKRGRYRLGPLTVTSGDPFALVRDVLAYLRLIATPSDDVACARVLSAPAWGFEAQDLVRLCAKAARNKRQPLWDAIQGAQGELEFAKTGRRIGELAEFVNKLRKRAWNLRASELLDELIAELGLVLPEDDANRPYLMELGNFVRAWEQKALTETGKLAELVRYLDDFAAANGQINLSESGGRDAVQLMTVHAAKGLEFDHVFVLRMTMGGFPVRPRLPVLEFPDALMKEESPRGDFQIQEERRLFYVALTRARKRLTLSTVIHARSKRSEFLEDFLSAPEIKKNDVLQLAPKLPAPDAETEVFYAFPSPTWLRFLDIPRALLRVPVA